MKTCPFCNLKSVKSHYFKDKFNFFCTNDYCRESGPGTYTIEDAERLWHEETAEKKAKMPIFIVRPGLLG